MELKIGQIWRHYKGKNYKILLFCKHSETGEELVVYQREEDGNIYARPMDLFFQNAEWEGKTVPRFTLITDNQ
jgi:hypothetical protein